VLRGAIDYTAADRIGGWVFSELGSVRNRKVLAFIDDVCVGAGPVDQFRQDLVDAGLGDGFLGFNFTISPPDPDAVSRLVVKVEGSDAALLQRESKVVGQPLFSQRPFDRSAAQLEWMRARGWLAQPDFDFLKFLNQVGAYDRSMLRPKDANDGGGPLNPAGEAKQLLELLCLQDVDLDEAEYADVGALAADAEALLAKTRDSVVALWTAKKGSVLIAEGSQHDEAGPSGSLDGAIEYACGPNRLLFLDLHCAFGSPQVAEAKAIKVFFARADEDAA
jgi:hypothetical protein